MRKRSVISLVSILALAFSLLAPGMAAADGGSSGPYYLAVSQDREAYVRGGQVLQESDFTESFRPQPGDQIFFGETLYHSTARGGRGDRAGRTVINCVVGLGQTSFCNGSVHLRGQGELYLSTNTAQSERFLAAVVGGTRNFKASRGDVVIKQLSNTRALYQLRLR
jgi:hypothetical protein